MPNYKGGMSDAPGQVTFPNEASKGYKTDVDGKVYPAETKRIASDYMSDEGSMGSERNQGAMRDGWKVPAPFDTDIMGQHKLQKLKDGGSWAI